MSEKACFWLWIGFMGAVSVIALAWVYSSNAPIRYLDRMYEIQIHQATQAEKILRDALRRN